MSIYGKKQPDPIFSTLYKILKYATINEAVIGKGDQVQKNLILASFLKVVHLHNNTCILCTLQMHHFGKSNFLIRANNM